MKLSEIYDQIAKQSGIENVYTFSDAIPGCFRSAFSSVLRVPASKETMTPMFEDEMLPLIEHVNINIPINSVGVGDYQMINIPRLSYVYGVSTSEDIFLSFQ